MYIQFETFGVQEGDLCQLQVTAKKQGKEGKHCIYFTQQNKDPLSAAVPQQCLTIIIYILAEPDHQKLPQNCRRSDQKLL